MTGGPEPHDDEPTEAFRGDVARTWCHPSELGLETRGTADRRRSSKLATVVLAGGVGLLIATVLIGRAGTPELSATLAETPTLPASVVAVSASGEERHGVAAGVVLDDAGHVLVDRHWLGMPAEGSTLWVERYDGRERPAKVLGVDPHTELLILAAEAPAAAPATLRRPTGAAAALRIIGAAPAGPAEVGTAVAVPTSSVTLLQSAVAGIATFEVELTAGSAPEGSWVYDERGELAGLVLGHSDEASTTGTVTVLNAAGVFSSAQRFLESAD